MGIFIILLHLIVSLDEWSTKFSSPDSSAFSYSLFYVYFEQYTFIKGVALQNLLLAVGAVFAAVLVNF